MLTTRKPMKRTGFQRKSRIPAAVIEQAGKNLAELLDADFLQSQLDAAREQRLAERAARQMACATPSPDNVTMAANDQMFAEPIEKENPLRNEPYRRLVAAGACKSCRIEGYSQHAHENEGKGKGLKLDDRRAMALCCTRPGVEGCHVKFDEYRLLPGGREAHAEQGRIWAAETRREIEESGQWPIELPKMKEGGSDAI